MLKVKENNIKIRIICVKYYIQLVFSHYLCPLSCAWARLDAGRRGQDAWRGRMKHQAERGAAAQQA